MKKGKKLLAVLLSFTLMISLASNLKIADVKAASNPYPIGGIDGSTTEWSNCTYSVWNLVKSNLGIELPAWGWAGEWYNNAANAGYSVGRTPAANSIKVTSGHVAFVTEVSADGSKVYVKEGGFNYQDGTNLRYHEGWVTAYPSDLKGYIYLKSGGSSGGNSGGGVSKPYFTNQEVQYTDEHNAVVYTRIQNPSCQTVSEVGCILWMPTGNGGRVQRAYSEKCGLSTSYVNYTCNFVSDMNCTLNPGTTYTYQQYAVINGTRYYDDVRSFTTAGNKDSIAPVVTYMRLYVGKDSFYVTLKIKEDSELAFWPFDVQIWTEKNGKDDLETLSSYSHYKDIEGNDVYEFHGYKKNHNNESGNYNCVIKISDIASNMTTLDLGTIVMSGYSYYVEEQKATIAGIPKDEEELTIPANMGKYPVKYLQFGEGSQTLKKLHVSEGIEEVGMVYGCPNLEQIVLPDSTLYFGGISDNSKITDINFLYNVQRVGSFIHCTGLKKIDIPIGVDEIGTFEGCENLTDIQLPITLKKINGNGVFKDCKSLKSITIPQNAQFEREENIVSTQKGYECDGLFSGCDSLQKVSIDSNNPYYCVDNNLIYSKDKTTVIADTGIGNRNIVLPNTVKKIDSQAFCGSDITGIRLPAGLEQIGFCAFAKCTNLKECDIPDSVNSTGIGTFKNCTRLEKVSFSKNCKELPKVCISGCTNLKEFIIPYGYVKINQVADYDGNFGDGSQVTFGENLRKVVIPSTIEDGEKLTFQMKRNGIDTYENTIFYIKKDSSTDKKIKELQNYEELNIIYDDTVDFLSLDICEDIIRIENVGGKKQIHFDLQPTSLDKSLVTWSSDDTSIASIDKNGNIVARKKGETYVRANIKVAGENKSVSCKVAVGKPTASISSEQTTKSAKVKRPKTSRIKKLKRARKALKVSWKKIKGVSGYQIQYATSKKFKKAKLKTIKNFKTTSKTIKRLKAKKKYYVRIRTYVVVKGNRYYSKWSGKKYQKTK